MTIYRQTCPLRSSDADFSGHLRIGSLIGMLTDIGWAHAHKLQVGSQHLSKVQLTWVNTSLRLELSRHIKWRQFGEITLQTWLAGHDKFYWMRDFLLFDEEGQEFARASTTSVLLHLETRRPYLKNDVGQSLEPAELPRVFAVPNAKLSKSGPWQERRHWGVHLGDLDANRHVSNACYAQWLLDSYQLAFCQQHRVAQIQLQYRKEALYDQEPTLLCQSRKEKTDDFYLVVGQTELLRARIHWRKAS